MERSSRVNFLNIKRRRRVPLPLEWEGRAVRVVKIDGEPWFVLADLARALGYQRTSDAAKLLRERQKGTADCRTPGGNQELTVVSEGGMYRLVMKSHSPVADDFQDWVTDEILPSIRKYGNIGLHESQKHRLTDVRTITNRDGHYISSGMWLVNLSGVFDLASKGRMDKAVAFRLWIMSEVLPSIFGTGKREVRDDDGGRARPGFAFSPVRRKSRLAWRSSPRVVNRSEEVVK